MESWFNRDHNPGHPISSPFGPSQLDFMYGLFDDASSLDQEQTIKATDRTGLMMDQMQSRHGIAPLPRLSHTTASSFSFSTPKPASQLRNIGTGQRTRAPRFLGCGTCRRRKVKCDKVRPACGHCVRLHLDCTWRRPQTTRPFASPPRPVQHLPQAETPECLELFDFDASFDFSTSPHVRSPSRAAFSELFLTQPLETPHDSIRPSVGAPSAQIMTQDFCHSPSTVNIFGKSRDEVALLQHFVEFTAPPILIGIEPSWSSTRDSLLEIAKSNAFVRHAICAFSSLSLEKYNNGGSLSSPPSVLSLPYYETALRELVDALETPTRGNNGQSFYEGVLASIFFLSYVELTATTSPRESLELLRRANEISRTKKFSWSAVGKRFRIWLKLLDTKALLAGGEGLYMSSTGDIDRVEEAEGSTTPLSTTESDSSTEDMPDDSYAEAIFLNPFHRPAYDFYLQVDIIQGHIAKLDKWHRSRGSVKDETEVMSLAAKITEDLENLWSQRPPILDFADKPKRMRQFLSRNPTLKLGRSMRTYIANYHACYLHLQRAVYYNLPLMPQVATAVKRVVQLARLSMQENGTIPASMLWPLMLTACEMRDDENRMWILGRIEGMEESVGNAARTAALVREILKRQAGGVRADARSVMQDMFGSLFAIL